MCMSEIDLLNAFPFSDVCRPVPLIAGKIGPPFWQELGKIRRVKRKVLRQIVRLVGGIGSLFDVLDFFFDGRRWAGV